VRGSKGERFCVAYFFDESAGACGMSALVAIHRTSASSSLVETAA
jgi:hypothetical protein